MTTLKCKRQNEMILVSLEVLVKCFPMQQENKTLHETFCCWLNLGKMLNMTSLQSLFGELFRGTYSSSNHGTAAARGGGGDGNTLCLGRGAVGVTQGQERSLHQLAEKHVLSDQDELSMLFPVVTLKRAVQLLHHTKDGNHQTCRDKIQEQTQTLQSRSQSPS